MPLSIYIHVPFCTVRCAYCDFNTYAGLEGLIPSYVDAVCREADQVSRVLFQAGNAPVDQDLATVHTIFFGGGTPSLLPAESIEAVLRTLGSSFALAADVEITVEANPGTLAQQDLESLRRAGVNRLSLGAQSAQADELRLLDRAHSFQDVVDVVGQARRAGFDNLNLDLIFGLPWQTMAAWQDTLHQTLALDPDHLSLYALSLEHGTPLRSWVERGLVANPDPDLAAEMYEVAGSRLEQAGYLQYEISNWARGRGDDGDTGLPGYACRHNVQYWRNLPYLGLGAGAHGCALGWRYSNVLSPRAYVARIAAGLASDAPCSPAVAERTPITPPVVMDETMLLGLRLTREGIQRSLFRERFGEDPQVRYGPRLEGLEADGLVERGADILRLTERGRLLGNRVFEAFV